MRFGEWIREYRTARGYKAVDCAERAGMQRQTWSEWESGRSRRIGGKEPQPRKETVQAIARGLQCTVEEVWAAAGIQLDHDYAADDVAPLVAYYNGLDVDDQDELLEIARRKWERKRKSEISLGQQKDGS